MSIRVAIVGCGRMGGIRARACQHLGAKVVQLLDEDKRAARELQQSFPDATAAEPAAIEWTQIDAVFVCTPPAFRGPIETAAIDNRTPFFVEKPVGLSVAAMLPVARKLSKSPIPSAVGYMNRYRGGVRKLRGRIADSSPHAFAAHWVNGIYSVPWWLDTDLSGGSLNEQATHFIDLTRHLFGNVAEVSVAARAHSQHPNVIGSAGIGLRLESGLPGTIAYSCEAAYKSMSYRVFCGHEELALEGWDLRVVLPEALAEPPSPDRNEIFHLETAAFLAAVRGEAGQVLCDFHDAMQTQAVADAVVRAIGGGTPERVQQVTP